MKSPIDISTVTDVTIVDEDSIASIGYFACPNVTMCNIPFHYMIELKNGRQLQLTKERFVQVIKQLGVDHMITMPEKVEGSKVGIQ